MGVIFTGDAEKRRTEAIQEKRAKHAKSWEYLKTFSEAEAVRTAKDMGWEQKKVQVRATRANKDEWEYTVEPFERDCKCPNILKYVDYFGGGPSLDGKDDLEEV